MASINSYSGTGGESGDDGGSEEEPPDTGTGIGKKKQERIQDFKLSLFFCSRGD